jgi:hypothetical protein
VNLDAPANPLTAKAQYDALHTYVSGLSQGMILYSVSCKNVTSEGLGKEWSYLYGSTIDTVTYMQKLCYMRSCNDTVKFDSSRTQRFMVGVASLPEKWMNSDAALTIAEKNGGRQFREKNQNFVISAAIGRGVVLDPSTYWMISYRSAADKNIQFYIHINAVTGSVKLTNP